MPDLRPPRIRFPSRLINRIRTRGPGEVLSLVKDRLLETIGSSDTLIFFVRETRGESLETRDDLTFRQATTGDASTYARDIGTDSTVTFKNRLSEATRSYLVESQGHLVHASWVTTAAAWTRELHAYVKPPRGDAYIYESFTRADARGRGVYPYALKGICAALADEGVERAWVAAEADNPASIRAITKAAFVEAFRVSYERRFGRLHIGEFSGEMDELGRKLLHRHA